MLKTMDGKAVKISKENVHFTYSKSEKWTGNYWVNGQKIYTKTLIGDGGDKVYPNGIVVNTNLKAILGELINYECIIYSDSDNRVMKLPFHDTNDLGIIITYELNNDRFAIYSKKRTLNRFWITVFYTKINDN